MTCHKFFLIYLNTWCQKKGLKNRKCKFFFIIIYSKTNVKMSYDHKSGLCKLKSMNQNMSD